jgi:trehalose 6-phosphate synthase/phosphatase
VNRAFASVAADLIAPDVPVWIHDYHLMLLPQMLRKKYPKASIGFFLHIPFPSMEIFRLLPPTWRTEILNGLLGADLIGFHTNDYTQYFLQCALRFLGIEHHMGQLITDGRLIQADTFPMGIDFDLFNTRANHAETIEAARQLKQKVGQAKIILSVDRLDYSKGIINRLKGFEMFLEKNPQWRKKVVYILMLVPSRIGVEQYQQLKKQIDELVGFINGKYSDMDWTPINYRYRVFPFDELVTSYTASEVALITPLRDGMNLVAKEYLSSHPDNLGVLILSEMAGASKELGEAVLVSPTTSEEISQAILQALEMPLEEQVRRNTFMRKRLAHYNVNLWVKDFFDTLTSVKNNQQKFLAKVASENIQQKILADYHRGSKRLLILDYDGTLVSFQKDPVKSTPPIELLRLLEELSSMPPNNVIIISGRNRDILDNFFGKLSLNLIAEHGVWSKSKKGRWQLFKNILSDWKKQILPILQAFSDRLPGSFVEEKEYTVVWHYRGADPEQADRRRMELADMLQQFTANLDVQIVQGHKILEVRPAGVSKGLAALNFSNREKYDFILAVGDDTTDEDLFQALPPSAYSIRVGLTNTFARYNMVTYQEVLEFLKKLV